MKRYLYVFATMVVFVSNLRANNIDLSRFTKEKGREYVEENVGISLYKFTSSEIILKLDTISDLIDLYDIDSMLPIFYYQKAYVFGEYENNIPLAIEYAKKSYDEALKFQNTDWEIDALLKMVELYGESYDFERSFQYSQLAKKRAAETKDSRRIATVNMTLASSHDKYDEYALELYRDAYKVVGHIKHNNVVILLNNFGRVFLFMDEPRLDSAEFYLSKALLLKNEIGAASLGNVECNLAEAYFAGGKFNLVEEICKEVLRKDEDNQTTVEAFNCRRMLARCAYERDAHEEAASYISEGLDLATTYPFLHQLIKKFTSTSKEVSEDMNDLKTYALLDSLYMNASDSIYAMEEKKRVSIIEAKMQLEEKQTLINQHEKIAESRLWLSLSLFLVLLAMGLGFYRYRRMQKSNDERRIKEIAELKVKADEVSEVGLEQRASTSYEERQQATNVIFLKEKQSLLNQVVEKIGKVNLEALPEQARTSFQEMEQLIGENLKNEEQWNSFLMHFERIHPSYFTKLKQTYPSLSQADRRLIAYMKMDLSSKEIAKLLGVNHSSINKSRYRLRKKMNIPKDIKLDVFLQGL